jgi:hypothetical protein
MEMKLYVNKVAELFLLLYGIEILVIDIKAL